jgi:hypothetical protein
MIGHDLQSNDNAVQFLSLALQESAQIAFDRSDQVSFAAFWNPEKVIINQTNAWRLLAKIDGILKRDLCSARRGWRLTEQKN